MTVEPQTRLRLHLKCRRHIQELPTTADLREHPLSMRPEQAYIAMHRREQPIDVDVSLRHHRVEHSAHPHRRGQRSLLRRRVATGAEYVTMRAQYTQLLCAQYDVTALTVEERQKVAALVALFMSPRAREHFA